MLEINKYINFLDLFKDLYRDHVEELLQYQYESDIYYKIIQFVSCGSFEEFEIITDECELNDRYIYFCFGMDIEQPNEDTSYVASATSFITYDRLLKEFTDYEYNQG